MNFEKVIENLSETIASQNRQIIDLVGEIKSLNSKIEWKDDDIKRQKLKIDQLEQIKKNESK